MTYCYFTLPIASCISLKLFSMIDQQRQDWGVPKEQSVSLGKLM